jgi:hypothetical protein
VSVSALLAWAADLVLGRSSVDAFTRSRVWFRRRHRATRACASASCARDRSRLPNQSDSRGHYGQNPVIKHLRTTGPTVAMLIRLVITGRRDVLSIERLS